MPQTNSQLCILRIILIQISSKKWPLAIELEKLDSTANQIAENQEVSLAERKKLAEETKSML